MLFLILGSLNLVAQTTYYSKASATDFNDVTSWGTAVDGTGTSPTSISNADNFTIANGAVMFFGADASVRRLEINAGTLSISANTLTVGTATTFDSYLHGGTAGTLTVSGGTINVKGSLTFENGATFNQSGGTISVDGNNAGTATGSVPAGRVIFGIGYDKTSATVSTTSIAIANVSKFNLTGGTLRIVDPHAVSTDYAVAYRGVSGANLDAGINHTLEFGNGTSTDAGFSATNGYNCYLWVSSGYMSLGNLIVNNAGGTNRWVYATSTFPIKGNLTINAASEFRAISTTYVGGNLTNNGTLSAISTLRLGSWANGVAAASTLAQTIDGAGVFRNLTASPTANFTSLTIDNSSASGITFANANSLKSGTVTGTCSSTLTFVNGIVNTGANEFILGVSTATVGTLTYTNGGFGSGSKIFSLVWNSRYRYDDYFKCSSIFRSRNVSICSRYAKFRSCCPSLS